MRLVAAAALAGVLGCFGVLNADAQSQPSVITPDSNTIVIPPAPPIVAAPSSQPTPIIPASPAPPGLVQTPIPPPDATPDAATNTDNGGNPPATPAPGAGSTASVPDQDVTPVPPNTWVPGKTAKIGVLDKIDGSVQELSIPVGGQSTVGDLQISVLACVIRPPDQVPDAAVFLALQSTGDTSAPPDYRGWLVRSTPGAAIAGDASETFRVIDCS